jgi:ribosomal protein S18 acetylase RimI-like enzyme
MVDEGLLSARLWAGFGRLQALLGGHAGHGSVIEREGLIASVVPNAPDSPTLNAAVATNPDEAPSHIDELRKRYKDAKVRRWGVWLDSRASLAAQALTHAGMVVTSASPGMGAAITELQPTRSSDTPHAADLETVGRVNDLAYGNYDGRLERTLAPLPNGILRGYKVDYDGAAAAVALALYHDQDCGISFVATVPKARRKGLATKVMRDALNQAQQHGCTTTTLQATDVGERLYRNLGYRHLCVMQLWELRR